MLTIVAAEKKIWLCLFHNHSEIAVLILRIKREIERIARKNNSGKIIWKAQDGYNLLLQYLQLTQITAVYCKAGCNIE